MATFYSITVTPPKEDGTWGKIEFGSQSKELFDLIENMIRTATDAVAWRNRVEEIHVKVTLDNE